MACEASSPSNSAAYSLVSNSKDFTSPLLAFEGSISSTRPLEELENVSPAAHLQLSTALDTASPPPIFEASTHIIPTPPLETGSLPPAPLSHYSPASSNASPYMRSSSHEQSPISPPNGSHCRLDDLFIISHHAQSMSSSRGSIAESLEEERASVIQLGELEQETVELDLPDALDANGVTVGECETTPAPTMQGDTSPKRKEESKIEAPTNQPGSPSKAKSDSVPRNVKLPQRKGGMQLWQFLYALLGNSASSKYGKLIEWTANRNSREFRLLEPEAIAIWWGEHKSKKNMSYDKLSRSLRYYYDKGIIRKIPGERYVYQFCIDPEVMYKHIGNSDCRPKLKPMPVNARRATSDYQLRHGFNHSLLHRNDALFIPPGPLMLAQNGLQGSYGSEMPFPPPDYPSLSSYPSSSYFETAAYTPLGVDMYASIPMTSSAALEYNESTDIKPVLPIRSQSYLYTQDSDGYGQPMIQGGAFLPVGPPPLQSISSIQPPSEGNSPQMSSFPQHPQLLDELIEPAASCELSHPPIVYSSCSEGPYISASEMDSAAQWPYN